MTDGARSERLAHEFAALAAQFFQRESNRQSLLTVTRASLSPDLTHATIFFTVLPQDAEQDALSFARRNGSEFRTFVKSHSNTKRLPFFEFMIDEGEKNRQRIDELTG